MYLACEPPLVRPTYIYVPLSCVAVCGVRSVLTAIQ